MKKNFAIPYKISTHSDNFYFHFFYKLSDWVEIFFKHVLKNSAFYLEKQKKFYSEKVWVKPRVNWLFKTSKQPAFCTDPIFNDGFGNDELAMEHQLVHMHCLTCALNTPKEIFFGALIHVLIRMMIYGAVPWEYITRIVFTYTYVRTHHHLFFMHDEKKREWIANVPV